MVSKVSEITAVDVANYIRADEPDTSEIETYLNIAKNFVSSYTGIPIRSDDDTDTLDTYPDFVIAIYVLCQDMYDNRTLYIDKNNMNMVVKTILDMHQRVFL